MLTNLVNYERRTVLNVDGCAQGCRTRALITNATEQRLSIVQPAHSSVQEVESKFGGVRHGDFARIHQDSPVVTAQVGSFDLRVQSYIAPEQETDTSKRIIHSLKTGICIMHNNYIQYINMHECWAKLGRPFYSINNREKYT